MALLTLFLVSIFSALISPGVPFQCQASYDRVDNCSNPLKTCNSASCGTILLTTNLTFIGPDEHKIRYLYTETTCATESFCASAGKPNFSVTFQLAECQSATPGEPPSSARLKGLSQDASAEPEPLRLTTLLDGGREASASSTSRLTIDLSDTSGTPVQCQASYDRVSNCTNPLKDCHNKSDDSCGTLLLSTSLAFKRASGTTTKYGYVVIACASESFCTNAGKPNLRMTYQMAECQSATPGDTTTSRTTTTTSIATVFSGCGRVMLASARVYLQALGCVLMAKAFSLCFVTSR